MRQAWRALLSRTIQLAGGGFTAAPLETMLLGGHHGLEGRAVAQMVSLRGFRPTAHRRQGLITSAALQSQQHQQPPLPPPPPQVRNGGGGSQPDVLPPAAWPLHGAGAAALAKGRPDEARQLSSWQHGGGSRAGAALADRLDGVAEDSSKHRADSAAAGARQAPRSRRQRQRSRDGGARGQRWDGGARGHPAPQEGWPEAQPPRRMDLHSWQPPPSAAAAHGDPSGVPAGPILRGYDIPDHAWIVLRALKDAGGVRFPAPDLYHQSLMHADHCPDTARHMPSQHVPSLEVFTTQGMKAFWWAALCGTCCWAARPRTSTSSRPRA